MYVYMYLLILPKTFKYSTIILHISQEVYEVDEEIVVGGPTEMFYEDNDYDEYGGDEYYW